MEIWEIRKLSVSEKQKQETGEELPNLLLTDQVTAWQIDWAHETENTSETSWKTLKNWIVHIFPYIDLFSLYFSL